mgnify:CR=1 FL=1
MMSISRVHLKALSKRPARAQTVQELKYDTLLVYLDNAYLMAGNAWFFMAAAADVFGELGVSGNIPYKAFFGGGAGSGGGRPCSSGHSPSSPW